MPTAARAAPDEVLLRRFGLVRAVGGAAYALAVLVLFVLYGTRVWPLLSGVVVLGVVTTAYFLWSDHAPRLAVEVSLAADAIVLAGAIAYLGGAGSGLVGLYAIVIVSGGILLGTGAAVGFTALTVAFSLLQLLAEALGLEPVILLRADPDTRLPVLFVSLAGLTSVGYLTSTYAGRLHELIAEAGDQATLTRRRGRRRRRLVQQASVAVEPPLREVEHVAEALGAGALSEDERRRLAARLRLCVSQLDAEVGQLADAGILGAAGEGESARPEPILLRRVVEDCLVGLGDRAAGHTLDVDVEPLKVLADRRASRRVVFNLLENAIEHTPPGTGVTVRARATAGHGVLVVADDGPGIPRDLLPTLFDAPAGSVSRGAASTRPRVGLPMVRELCEQMGAQVRHEAPRSGKGARFLIAFRLAPRGAPSQDDPAPAPAAAE